MRVPLLVVIVFVFAVVLTACGSEDRANGPFFVDARLVEDDCRVSRLDFRCLVLETEIGGSGTAFGTCRIVALADDFETELVEVDRIDRFVIAGGERHTFVVEVPEEPPSDRFLRWQAICEPGPEG